MNRIKPWHPFIVLAVIFVVLSLTDKSLLDFHLHDTYYVVSAVYWYIGLAILSLVASLIYFLANKYLYSRVLTWTHILGSFLTILFSFATIMYAQWSIQKLITTGGVSYEALFEPDGLYRWSALGVLLFFLLQFVFFYNLIAGIVVRSKMK